MREHGFDPRAKGLAYLLASGLVLLTTAPAALLVGCGLLGALLVRLGLVRRWLSVVRLLLPTLLLFAIVAGLGGGGEAAAGATLRLLALVSTGVLFFATTPPEELGEALMASGLRPPVAFLLEGTLRYVATMGTLVREVRDAQASRGIRLDGLHLLRNGPALLAPTLVSAVRFADDLAEGLETRGFGSPRRTLLRDYRWTARDWLLVTGLLAVGLVVGWLVLR